MKSRHIPVLVVAFVLALAAAAEEKKCHASARECELQIRTMLTGRRYLGLTVQESHPGLVVLVVRGDGPAARAGFKVGDRLIGINGKSLEKATVADFKKAVADARHTGRLFVIVLRRGAYRKIEVRLEPYTRQQIEKIVSAHLADSHNTATASGHP